MNDDFGPKWCMTSEEVGAGAGVFIAVMAVAFILAPAFFVGFIIAQLIWDVKIFKYPFATLFAVGYFYLLSFIFAHLPIMAFATVVGVWLLLDYASAKGNMADMFVVKTISKLFKWLFTS